MSLMTRLAKIAQSIILILIVAAIFIFWHMSRDPNVYPIKSVKIAGNHTHLTRENLEQAIVPYAHSSFFAFDSHALRQRLLGFPWVEDVTIKRIWPDTIVVDVIEQVPVARLNQKGVINRKGDVFYPNIHSIPANLPIFIGPPQQSKAILTMYQSLSDELKALGLHISEIHLTDRRSWTLTLNNGMVLLLGRTDTLERVQHFVKSYQSIFGSKGSDAEREDLRYANGLAVKWKHVAMGMEMKES